MKKICLSLLILTGLISGLKAQQDAQYTNFMFNKLPLNPAYAGSRGVTSILALYRNQWYGMEGAPNTQTLSFHTPLLKQRLGLGIVIDRDQIAFFQNYRASMAYAYRIPVGKKGNLSFGLQGSVRLVRADWTQAKPGDDYDPNIPLDNSSKFLPNFGAGVYFSTERFYAGLSVPHLLNGDIDFSGQQNPVFNVAQERRHVFLMSGVVLPLSRKVKFNPNLLLKYVQNAPFDMDLNASFIFFDKLTLGATWRMGDSFDGLLSWNITPQLRLGLGYDYTLTKLRSFNDGSYEIFLGWDFVYRKDRLVNPRFF